MPLSARPGCTCQLQLIGTCRHPPAGQLVEVSFAELERDPLGTLRRMYSGLGLGDFEALRPRFQRYIGGLEMSCFKKVAHRWARGAAERPQCMADCGSQPGV